MTGVQIIGKQAVISRYETFEADTWALYQGKQFMVAGRGADKLTDWVESFESSGSTATYTLRVYDADELPTPASGGSYMGCFNFKLVDMYQGHGIAGHTTKLMERISALEKERDSKDGDGEENNLNDVIMGWLDNPEKLGMVVGAIRQALGLATNAQPALSSTAPLQTISGMNNSQVTDSEGLLARLSSAIDRLEKKDARLIEHLEKLATLAETDSMLFNAVLAKLDAL